MNNDEYDIKRRAFIAYFKRFGENALIPSQTVDFIEENGKDYIVLSNTKD